MILLPQARGVIARRQVLDTLVRRDLRVRYASSAIGYLWTIIDPLAMALIYFVVFTYIFEARRVGYQPYVLFILVGVLAWQWFSQCATETSRALLAEARLVRSTNLPRELWVVRIVIAKGIEFLLSLPVLAGFAIYFIIAGQTTVHYRILLFPLAIGLQFLLSVGLGLILAPVTVIFTDMPRIVRIALRMGFYATPIIYPPDQIPAHTHGIPARQLLELNPMADFVGAFRDCVYTLEFPGFGTLGLLFLYAAVSFTVGWRVFHRRARDVSEEL